MDNDSAAEYVNDCPALGGCYGSAIGWHRSNPTATGETIEVGHCRNCGTFAIRCGECESIMTSGETCGCDVDMVFEAVTDRKAIEEVSVTRTAGGVETKFDW